MTRLHLGRACLATGIVVLTCAPAYGQWVDQTFSLQIGRNTIYLEVEPEDNAADAVFVTTPADAITTVWTWRPVDAGIGIACPDENAPECQPSTDSGWRLWLPASNPDAATLNSLYAVRGGQVYVIEASAPATLTIRGKPDTSKTRWLDGFNVAGFHVDPSNVPSFQDYLAPSASHANTQIFEMNLAGDLVEITDLTTPIVPGKGYWVSSATNTDYDGPLNIDHISLRGLNYGRRITEYQVQFENLADAARTVNFSVATSLAPPASPAGLPTNSGAIPMKWRDYETNPDALFLLQDLNTGTSADFSVNATGEIQDAVRIVRVSVDRLGQSIAEVDPETGSGAQYQSILTINDGAGFRRQVAVTSEVQNQAGLYVGTVTVDHVAWVQADARVVQDPDAANGYENPFFDCNENLTADSIDIEDMTSADLNNNEIPDECESVTDLTTPRATTDPFVFPVLVHFDGTSTYKFLTEATLLFKPFDGIDPARFVIATPDCPACDDFFAGSVVDGERFKLRFGTAAFAFDDDLTLSGGFGTALTGSAVVAADDPLNPFRHKYHPDHSGEDPGETWAVKRDFGFSFDCSTGLPFTCGATATALSRPGSGDIFLTGCYFETLSGDGGENGLHKRAINVCGKFDLQRISSIALLNDGM
jgi:hypothetical protein